MWEPWKHTSFFFQFLKIVVKIELPYDLVIPLLGIYLKRPKTMNLKRYMHASISSSGIIDNCQEVEATSVSIDRWMDKEDVVPACIHVHVRTQRNTTEP